MRETQPIETEEDADIEAAFAELPSLAAQAEARRLEVIARWVTKMLAGLGETPPSE